MPAKTPQSKKAILLVDDHPMLRRGVRALIESEPGLAVCGEAATHQAALDAITQCRPDLAIVDLGLEEGTGGLDLLKDIKAQHNGTLTLVLSMYNESVYAERAFAAGARGYLTKQEMDETILIAIHQVLSGGMHMSETMKGRFAEKFLGGQSVEDGSPIEALSDRELEVFRSIGQGESSREIAERLGRSIKTIESHRENIKQKLTYHTGAALVRGAVHWVDTGEAD